MSVHSPIEEDLGILSGSWTGESNEAHCQEFGELCWKLESLREELSFL